MDSVIDSLTFLVDMSKSNPNAWEEIDDFMSTNCNDWDAYRDEVLHVREKETVKLTDYHGVKALHIFTLVDEVAFEMKMENLKSLNTYTFGLNSTLSNVVKHLSTLKFYSDRYKEYLKINK